MHAWYWLALVVLLGTINVECFLSELRFVDFSWSCGARASQSTSCWLIRSLPLDRFRDEIEDQVGEDDEENLEEPVPCGVIGPWEARDLLKLSKLRKEGSLIAPSSLDLGKSTTPVHVLDDGIGVDSGPGDSPVVVVSWDDLKRMVKKADKGSFSCWELFADGVTSPMKVSAISGTTNMPAALCAPLEGPGAPTMVLGGFGMHRIANGMDPGRDTQEKIAASGCKRRPGKVLDICTGLGYTAIAAAALPSVTHVVTLELDEVSLEICRRNPWSADLFDNEKITVMEGDACELVKQFETGEFATVIHDPPARALCKASDLYGAAFYQELHRVLQRGGTLFHYIGNPDSKEAGRQFRGVMDRLRDAGFANCKVSKAAYGVVCTRN